MVEQSLVECSFLIPMRRDANLSDGKPHSRKLWIWLGRELENRFEGWTVAPGHYKGFYRDPDTRERVSDKSVKYVVALQKSAVKELRLLLSAACVLFQQKCIYLSLAGKVEFIEAAKDGA